MSIVGNIGFVWLCCVCASVAHVLTHTLGSFGLTRLAILAALASSLMVIS